MRSILRRTEIRLYLGTVQQAAARERVSLALAHVVARKRLSKRMHEVSEHARADMYVVQFKDRRRS